MRPKVKFLTVVWGGSYIERFASLALPSFLAPGNLPALAAATDLEVVVMTAATDIARFDEHAAFRRLREICGVRFVEIDDLITTGVYGVTLTLAYARPIIACGEDMVNTHFVFMNADFVLADGSLHGLTRHIVDGRPIVLGPSFRSVSEAVEPLLLDSVDGATSTLAMPPRKMVELAFRHPHPTTLAKTVNLGFCHSIHPNQFFWQVDEHTLLGRYYLIFMLCLKPERVIRKIDSYCDYGFIPEMCPSGNTAVMGDSDEFFMLEMQGRDQEMSLLYLGRASGAEIARSLDEWTTAEHRQNAKHDVVFHTREPPAQLHAVSREATAFIDNIERRLGPPVAHNGHPYWIGGVQTWCNRRGAQGLAAQAVELGQVVAQPEPLPATVVGSAPSAIAAASRPGAGPIPFKRRVKGAIRSLLITGRNMLLGERPQVTCFHPEWLDYRLLWRALASIAGSPSPHVLVIREVTDRPDARFKLGNSADFAEPSDVINGKRLFSADGTRYNNVLIYLFRKDCRLTRSLIDKCRPAMTDDCVCHVFIHHHQGEYEVTDFSAELVRYFDDIIAWPAYRADFCFAGGVLKRFNRHLFNIYGAQYFRSGPRVLPLIIPALLLTLPLVAMSNLYLANRQRNGLFVQYCSSMLIRITLEPRKTTQ